MNLSDFWRRGALRVVLTLVLVSNMLNVLSIPTALAAGTITGTVFRDLNANGVKDASETYGAAGVSVTAYDASNTAQGTATTAANGTYSLSATGTGPYRIEFTTLPAGYYPGPQGSSSGSTVQFVPNGNSSNVNLGINYPTDYSQANPNLVTNIYINGDANTTTPNPALLSFPYTSSGTTPAPTTLETKDQIGSTWGLAYARSSKLVYSAAFLKRHVGVGPSGLGAIYKTDTAGATTLFADLTTLGVNVGTVLSNSARGLGAPSSPSTDPTTFDQIGKVGLGGLALSDDESTLYVVNLNDKTLYALNVPAGTLASSLSIPDPGCTGGAWRPFGLKFYHGSLYVGGVCDAQTSQLKTDLKATVYRLTGTTFTNVLNIPLTYTKGPADQNCPTFTGWYPWVASLTGLPFCSAGIGRYTHPSPLLTGIEFDVDGSMIIGFADRFGHQLGSANYTPTGTTEDNSVGGDILRAYNNNGTFVLENNATAGTTTTSGAGNNQGPGGGEFYYQDSYQNGSAYHYETSQGGLALLPGSGQVALTSMDPQNFNSGGVNTFSNTTGAAARHYQFYAITVGGTQAYFTKANGLGDLELLLDPAPIEIGNRVWNDANNNGIQDPGEASVAGVKMGLYTSAGVLIDTVTTDSNGTYIFSSATGTDVTGRNYGVAIQPNTSYTVAVYSSNMATGGALAGLIATTANSSGNTTNQDVNGTTPDTTDSDGVTVAVGSGTNAATVGVSFTTGGAGSNNHGLDFGFVPYGTIQIVKKTVGGDGTFTFTSADATLNAVSITTTGNTGNSGTPFTKGVGTYTISEDAIPNWTLTDLSCTGDTNNDSVISTASRQVAINLDANENIVCTFTNTNTTPGSITVLKQVSTTDGSTPTVSGNFTVNVDCQGAAITPGSSQTVAAGSSVTFSGIPSGSTCTVGEDLFSLPAPPSGYVWAAQQASPVQTTLGSGQTVAVTLKNTLAPVITGTNTLTVTKTVAGTGSGPFNISITGPGGYVNNTTINGGQTKAFTALASGVYTVTETSPGIGWTTIYTATPGVSNSGNAVVTLQNANTATLAAIPISGKVFNDYNKDGLITTSGPQIDTGIAGVIVKVTDKNGNLVGSATTSSTGAYTVNPTGPGPYRVDFTNLPAGYEPTIHGSDNGTSTQFVNTSTGGTVNAGFTNSQTTFTNTLITSKFWVNASTTGGSAQPAIVSYQTSALQNQVDSTIAQTSLATQAQVGTVDGLAYRVNTQTIYAAAFAHVNAQFGPGGIGAIYKVSPTNAYAPSVFATVPNVGTFGNTAAEVGTVGLGDLKLSSDQNTLYTINIAQKQLVSIPLVGNPATAGAQTTTALPQPADCAATDTHPFALTTNNNKVYIGMTCGAPTASMRGYVYEYDGSTFTQVVSFPFNYKHLTRYTNSWTPWTTTGGTGNQQEVTHPWVTSLDFDNGDIVIGVRNQFTDQANGHFDVYGGDILRACANASAGWTLESNATCGTRTTAGANIGTGPGNGEYYYQDDGVEGEASFGGIAVAGGYTYVTQEDRVDHGGEIGVMSLNNLTGQFGTSGNLMCGYTGCSGTGALATNGIGKANGLGDIEAITTAAPIEIGNRVWNDLNGNGVQDAGEPGLASQIVSLQGPSGTSTAITDANGQYYFGNLTAHTAYTVTMSVPSGFQLTQTNAASLAGASVSSNHPISDTIDSDAALVSTLPTIYYTTGSAGQNNHGLDFGYTKPLSAKVDILNTSPRLSLGNMVWNDSNNNGLYDATESTIPGVRVKLYAADGTTEIPVGPDGKLGTADDATGGMLTDANGLYLFSNLAAGDYVVVLPASNFAAGGALVNYTSSTGAASLATGPYEAAPDPDTTPADNDDNGTINGTLGSGGDIRSAVITLALGTEPLNESPDNDAVTPDSNENLTVDFGVFQPVSIGDFVWLDTNRDGIQDTGEPGIPGVTVKVFDSTGTTEIPVGPDGKLGTADDAPGGMLTDANGKYLFTNLPPGQYQVKFTPPTGYTLTTTDAGTNDAVDSDGLTPTSAVLAGGQQDLTLDVGFYLTPTPTSTSTNTPTASNTPTNTPTASNTPTNTPTASNTPTDTATPTNTPTNTPTASNTPTNTPTASNTPTSTSTPTNTPVVPVQVGDFVWLDSNRDGIQDPGEPGIQGVTVKVFDSTGTNEIPVGPDGILGTADDAPGGMVTDANGKYLFTNLPPGQYQVKFTPPSGYTLTTTDAGTNDAVDSDGLTPVSKVLAAGEQDLTLDVGFYLTPTATSTATATATSTNTPTATSTPTNTATPTNTPTATSTPTNTPVVPVQVGDYVWLDNDRDGVQDAGEPGIQGVTVKLFDSTGTNEIPVGPDGILGTADDAPGGMLTDANGKYLFTNLPPGQYQVKFTPPAGYTLTTTDAGTDDTKDSDGLTPVSKVLTAGQQDLTLDVGFYLPVTIGDFVWLDNDRDGVQDVGEPGIQGVTVKVFDSTGTTEVPVGPDGKLGTADDAPGGMLTDANGKYLFTNLPPGQYQVKFTPPTGYILTTTDAGTNDAVDSDGLTPVSKVLAAGEQDLTLDVGFYQPVSLGNQVWYDTNNDGQINTGEVSVDGVKVELFLDANGNGTLEASEQTPLATQTTSNGGYYLFTQTTNASGVGTGTALAPGTYIVGIAPSNFATGGVLAGSRSSGTTLSTGGSANEVAISGNGTTDSDKDNYDDGLTQTTGFYTNGVLSGPIAVAIGNEPSSEPTFGQTAGSTPGHFNTVDGTATGVPIADANSNLTVDFGFYRQTLGNLVWLDSNNNGLYDAATESPIAGATVKLFAANGTSEIPVGPDGILGTADDAPGGVTTLAAGTYLFSNLPQGSYIVEVTPPAGYISSTDIASTTNPDNYVDSDDNGVGNASGVVRSNSITLTPGNAGTTGAITITNATGTTQNPTLDFGFYQPVVPVQVGDYVWLDNDRDGVQDAGEPGIQGVTVKVFDSTGTTEIPVGPDGVLGTADDAPGGMVTDANGKYLFTNLPPGQYQVKFTPPAGYTLTTTDAGTDDTKDSDGLTPVSKVLAAGEQDLTLDVGFYLPVSIGDYVWLDNDRDGVQDVGEPGIQGVTVKVFDSTGTTEVPVGPDGKLGTADDAPGGMLTDANGKYLFTNLPPGQYQVKFTPPAGYTLTTTDAGTDDTKDSDGLTPVSKVLAAGEQDLTLDVGFYLPVSIGDFVWLDNDRDGVQDAGEPGIQGVTVKVFDSTGTTEIPVGPDGKLGTADDAPGGMLTDANGKYLFTNLPPGQYQVKFTPPAGYTMTTTDAGSDDTKDSDGLTPVSKVLAAGEQDLTLDVGFYLPVSIGDFVWLDNDRDGVQDAGEPGIQGVTVKVFDSTGTNEIPVGPDGKLGTADDAPGGMLTDANGKYLFTNLPPGQYQVKFTPPAGYTLTTTDAGTDDTVDSDGLTPVSKVLTAGQQDLTLDVGFYLPVSIGDYVWLDNDRDGVQDTGEPGIQGVTVKVFDSTGTTEVPVGPDGILGTADDAPGGMVTDANGKYLFTNLPPGQYQVKFTPPSGYTLTTTDAGSDDTVDSDGLTPVSKVLAAGEQDLTLDVGFYQSASLGDFVWNDKDHDGVQDAGEPGINGVTVHLYDSTGTTLISTTTTTGNGGYHFDNLIPNTTYVIKLDNPADYAPGGPLEGFTLSPVDKGGDDGKDSDATPVNGYPTIATATTGGAGTDTPTYDIGLYQPLSLGNLLWNDVNNNGLKDSAEAGIDGVTVNLYQDSDNSGTLNAGDTLVSSQPTSNGGHYLFTDLAPATYLVQIAGSNFQAGGVLEDYISSTGTDGKLAGPYEPVATVGTIDNDDNGTTITDGIVSGPIPLAAGTQPTDETDLAAPTGVTDTASNANSNLTIDFGVFQPASLGDYVWIDTNKDGVQDAGELGVNGVQVGLYDSTGITLIATTTTANNGTTDGYYHFGNLTPNTSYVVKLDRPADLTGTGPLANYTLTSQDAGSNDATDSDAALIAGVPTIAAATTGGPGSDTPTYDFGFNTSASLGDYIWLDANKDGVQDPGESGINGVTVNLYDATGTTLIATTVTANNGVNDGYYHFANLQPNTTYVVKLDNPADFTSNGPLANTQLSPTDAGGDDASDSDATLVGSTPTIATATTGGPGSDTPTYDIGVYRPTASIGDFVWNDTDHDGVQDPGESGINGVTVHLYDTNGTLIATTTTTGNGAYHFDNLIPNTTYVIKLDNPADYAPGGPLADFKLSPADQGGDDAKDSDATSVGGYPTITTATTGGDGSDTPTYDIGLYQPLSLGNLVWKDANNNGLKDSSEAGIDGVKVNLYLDTNGNGALDASDTLVSSQQTSNGGHYLFTDLAPATYLVQLAGSNFQAGGVLENYISSTGTNGAATGPYEPGASGASDNDDNGTSVPSNGIVSGPVVLKAGTQPVNEPDTTLPSGVTDPAVDPNSNLTIDFGVFRPASLGSTVWYDNNHDGVKQPDEPGVPNVTVTLYDANGTPIATTTTDPNGHYEFTNLTPGTYSVGFTDLPKDYTFTTPNQGGNDGDDSDADPSTGMTTPVTLVEGENNPTLFAGIEQTPTAIALARFSAKHTANGVDVAWTTSAELNTFSYHLYRSTSANRADATRITDQPIAAQGRGGLGADYSWTDTTAQSGTTYWYWLEETEVDGSTHTYGPVSTTHSGAARTYTVLLPIVKR